MGITSKRKKEFCNYWFPRLSSLIGFVDVGSGGLLKYPWDLIPLASIKKFDFEPTGVKDPLCISDHQGEADFYVAKDERGSSLHRPLQTYIERFGDQSMVTKKTISVRLNTLDDLFQGKKNIDCIDINAEGHDYYVLKGASRLFNENIIKLVKIEFELARVWQGQGCFGDIEAFMRNNGFELADIEIEHRRPKNVKGIFHKGEPLWGKAYYAPAMNSWEKLKSIRTSKDDVLKGIILYVVFDMPGRAMDLVNHYGSVLKEQGIDPQDIARRISPVFQFAKAEHYGSKFLYTLKNLLGH